jgi:hypothetical protein
MVPGVQRGLGEDVGPVLRRHSRVTSGSTVGTRQKAAMGSHLLADHDSLESRRYPSVRRKTGPAATERKPSLHCRFRRNQLHPELLGKRKAVAHKPIVADATVNHPVHV